MTSDIQRFSDAAMFQAAPMKAKEPKVSLLSMNADPLGSIAAACRMYEGYPTYSLDDITDEDRKHYFEQVKKTHLKAPLEFVNFHFFLEGVDRAFTHQMVRQRTAVYAQESMRFAVKDKMAEETPLPPSVPAGSFEADIWKNTIEAIQVGYESLIGRGVPAEDARGLLPHATLTRLNYGTNLRSLLDHAGNRLCTQAQFHWRTVFLQIAKAIREYPDNSEDCVGGGTAWQFIEISKMFLPVCYQMGKCPFKADFDRGCTIRDRVDAFSSANIPSSEWHEEHMISTEKSDFLVDGINPAEWMLLHDSAYVKPGDPYGDQSHRR